MPLQLRNRSSGLTGRQRSIIFALCSLAFVPSAALAQLSEHYTLPALLNHSQLVVIAQPTSNTADTDENGQDRIGVITPFKVRLVLKGDVGINSFTLHHYRGNHESPEYDARFISFKESETDEYLMFLTIETDGRYIPTDGQVDSMLFSIKKLEN